MRGAGRDAQAARWEAAAQRKGAWHIPPPISARKVTSFSVRGTANLPIEPEPRLEGAEGVPAAGLDRCDGIVDVQHDRPQIEDLVMVTLLKRRFRPRLRREIGRMIHSHVDVPTFKRCI